MFLHLGDGVLVDEMLSVGQEGNVDRDEVGVGQQFVHLNVASIGDGGDPVLIEHFRIFG